MPNRRPHAARLLLAALLPLATLAAHAQDAHSGGQPGQSTLPAAPENRSSTGGGGETNVQPSEEGNKPLFERATLLPDAGLRPALAAHGLTLGLSEIDEILGNPAGGVRRGVIYEGLTQLGLGLDTGKAFGWSDLPSADLPSGGPAYPLTTPGIRLRWFPRNDLTLLAGLFNANPAGPGTTPPQYRDPSNTAFRLGDGVFAIAEIQYALNSGDNAAGLPGTYKVGAWYNSATFADQLYSAPGVSLAQSQSLNAGTQAGLNRRGNYSLYAVADQLVWRPAGQKDGGVGVFARAMGAPGDRNLVNFYFDTGATWKGPIPGRDSDTAGLAFAYARISDTAAALDAQIAASNPTPYPVRRNESVLELTYQAQIAPWWQLQPTAQYLFNLNGGVLNPANPGKHLPDAAILGLRTQVTF